MKARALTTWIVALIAAALVPTSVRGGPLPTTLNNLLVPGVAVQVGELTFSNFAYMTNGPDMPPALLVDVNSVVRNDGVGLVFISTWQNTVNNGAIQSARIAYTVTTTGRDINDASLFAIPLTVLPMPPNTDGFVTVSESLLIVPAGPVPTLRAFAVVNNGVPSLQLGDHLNFPPRRTIDVVTTLNLVNDGGTPLVGSVEETFSFVPEPSSITLLGLGAVGLLGYGWRRRKQPAA